MNNKRLVPLVVVGALAFGAPAASAATTINGLVGPGFNISVSKGGSKVTSLKAGRYTFKVVDKSSAHNFVLNGPGVKNKEITGLSAVTTKSMTVTLKKGTYTFYCTPHPTMKGTFKVT